jgi:transcription termination factor Rho
MHRKLLNTDDKLSRDEIAYLRKLHTSRKNIQMLNRIREELKEDGIELDNTTLFGIFDSMFRIIRDLYEEFDYHNGTEEIVVNISNLGKFRLRPKKSNRVNSNKET